MLQKLLKLFNDALLKELLPSSMTRANIMLILKPGKDSVDPNYYRPISPLLCDIKVHVKVLAGKFNKVITSVIHSEQASFMLQKSTSINLHRLFINRQNPSDDLETGSLLSLNATKAFAAKPTIPIGVLEIFGFGPAFIAFVKLLYAMKEVDCIQPLLWPGSPDKGIHTHHCYLPWP